MEASASANKRMEAEDETVSLSPEEEEALAREADARRGPCTILGVEIDDILGMRGENEGTALWRVRKAQLADEATMERVRVELGCGDLRRWKSQTRRI